MANPSMMTTPALVLSVGHGLGPAIAEVERIFFQSDPRRMATARFLALNLGGKKNKAELIPICTMQAGKSQEVLVRKQIVQNVREQADVLKTGVRSALHELRAHEKLIEVGLGGKSVLPLDVILVADLSKPDSAALIPLVSLIQPLLAEEPEARLHLLLSTAGFEEDPLADVNVYVSLGQLREWLEGSVGKFDAPTLQVYLFDRFKEGIWETRDAAEVHIILGNFLLALLSGGLAQHLAHSIPQLEMAENHAFFNGASATVLFFDMEQTRRACALRLGAEIVESEFHSGITPDPGPAEEMADYFVENHANAQTWIMELCRETQFHAHPAGLGLELHFSDLYFEDVPMQDWGKTIQAFDRAFQETRLPAQRDFLSKNAETLNTRFLEQFNEFTRLLPQLPRLYPGGIRSTRLVLERIRGVVSDEQNPLAEPPSIEQEWAARIQESLNQLEGTLRLLPKPPRWLFHLPAILRNPAIQLFQLVFLRRELQALLTLRQNSVRLLEQKYAVLFEQSLSQALAGLCKDWVESLDAQLKTLARLQSALNRLQRRFVQRTNELTSSPSMFRLSALDDSVLAWAYYYGTRPQDGFRHALLTEHGFLKDWHKASAKTLETRLSDFCREVYQPLEDVDLEEAIQHRTEKDADELALALMQGAVPLLRPNFDQTGIGSSFQLRFFQSRQARSSLLSTQLRNDLQEWQEVDTDDPYLAICCRVRLLIPLPALNHILERGRVAFEDMEESVKAEFSSL